MIKLKNGIQIPTLFYGTGVTQLRDQGLSSLKLKTRFRLNIILNNDKKISIANLSLPKIIMCCMQNGLYGFDTSRAYGASEFTLGKTLRQYKREKYYICTKLCNSDQYKGKVREGLETSLRELGLDYIDLYLMHWPVEGCFIDSWKEMEKLYKEGKCRSIGVCNFNIKHFEELRKYAEEMPMVNEIECHPLFTQEELRSYCKNNDIQIMAYTSTARMDERLLKTCLVPIAKKHIKTVAQIILRWHQQVGNVPIVNSSDEIHMLENININDFTLSAEEVDAISAININSRLRYDPGNCDFKQL